MKFKNSVLLSVIYIFTILGVIYFCKIYSNSSKVIDSVVSESVLDVTGNNYDELYSNVINYSKENDSFIIYVSSYKNSNNDSFEKTFEGVITEYNLKNKILFINADKLSSFKSLNTLMNSLDSDYEFSVKNLPILVSVKDGKAYSFSSCVNMDESSIKKLLEEVYD